jgi:hypothetical protein
MSNAARNKICLCSWHPQAPAKVLQLVAQCRYDDTTRGCITSSSSYVLSAGALLNVTSS